MQDRLTQSTKPRLLYLTIPAVLAIVGLVFSAGSLSAQEEDASTVVAANQSEVEDSEEVASEEEADAALDDGDAESDSEEIASEDESDDESEQVAEEAESGDQAMEEMTVTGSRLPVADPTALVHSYTAEDIALTGASTLDDFFRTVPWQFNSTNPQTSYLFNSGDELGGDSGRIYGKYDFASINLQGLGSSNTLVLLNGRRVAGYGGSERDIVNILGIPMQAIERVEIQLDGGSAVYGSDAVAGVVNFITKKNYRGMTVDVKDERSGTESDLFDAGMTFGLTWGRGNGTLTLSKNEQEPILNAKTRFTTRDYRDKMGPEFDYRNYFVGQPGLVRHWNCSNTFPGPYSFNLYCDGTWTVDEEKLVSFQLPKDHSGLGAEISDFNSGPSGGFWTYPEHIDPYDRIERENGSHTKSEGATLNLQHELFRGFKLFLDGLYSERYSKRNSNIPYISVVVPASNAYNPWDVPMHVSYAPGVEQENGLLPTPYSDIETTNNTATIGFEWSFRPQQTIESWITESRTETVQLWYTFNVVKERYAEGTDEFYRRLSSPDPDEAFNFFGNGTHQTDAFGNFLGNSSTEIGLNRTTSYGIELKGFLFNFRGDEISYVIGTRRRAVRYQNRFAIDVGWLNYDFDQNAVWNGTTEPVVRNESYFGEVWVPLLTEQHAGWWGQSLHLTLKNTRTIDIQWGPVGGGIDVDLDIETGV
ncbi:MAG: TonB-dependent receptor plug domain-containing protein, partial [Gammaproteobacteria bacterium]|nr:TonB-dependent receptor plug domain-containing protein [Gammaproteobacteria bacterium]